MFLLSLALLAGALGAFMGTVYVVAVYMIEVVRGPEVYPEVFE
jgi:hypothetical protein